MRISIEVDLTPEEIPLARDLFAVLHQITSQIRPRDTRRLFQNVLSALHGRPDALESVVQQLEQVFATLTVGTPPEEVVDDLIAAFQAVTFAPSVLIELQTVQSFMPVLPRLPEPFKSRTREKIVPLIMKQLTSPRAADANRAEFFLYVDAFAVLVRMEYVSVQGAARTILSLLRKQDTRLASLMMLCKTLEYAPDVFDRLPERVALVEEFAELLRSMAADDALRDDAHFALRRLGRPVPPAAGPTQTAPSSAAAAVSPPATKSTAAIPAVSNTSSHPASSSASPASSAPAAVATVQISGLRRRPQTLAGHGSTVFAMAYNERARQLYSFDSEGAALVWSPSGRLLTRWSLPQPCVASSVDILENGSALVIAAKGEGAGPSVLLVGVAGPSSSPDSAPTLSIRATLPRKDARTLPFVATMPAEGRRQFLLSESLSSPRIHRVALIDAASPGAPVRTFASDAMVSCLRPLGGSGQALPADAFAAAASNGTVAIWDSRQGRQAMALQWTASPINSLDVRGTLLLAGNIETGVVLWDLRAAAAAAFQQGASASSSPNTRGIVREFPAPGGVSRACFVGDAGDLCWAPSNCGLQLARAASGDVTAAKGDSVASTFYSDLVWESGAGVLAAANSETHEIEIFVAE